MKLLENEKEGERQDHRRIYFLASFSAFSLASASALASAAASS